MKGRSLVIKDCRICRRFQARALQTPVAPLPSFWVQEAPPFLFTGVDFAGPIYVKQTVRDNCTQKVWIALFTCCVVRAIHLEIVNDLTPQSFIRCLKRFTARRGVPERIISDNGTTFKAASKTLVEVLKHPKVQRQFGNMQIKWTFNIERAPWWGGFFECMIQSMKVCLRKWWERQNSLRRSYRQR